MKAQYVAGKRGKGSCQLVSQFGKWGQAHLLHNLDVTCVPPRTDMLALMISNSYTFHQSFTLYHFILTFLIDPRIYIQKGNKNVERIFM